MSIYATLWTLKFPRHGDDHFGCEWIEVTAQGVPAHIGSPAPGLGYEDGDPYAAFLPPAISDPPDDWDAMRAVVFVTEETEKGTPRCGQEYDKPLLVLTGEEYERMTFAELHRRLCDILARGHPRCLGGKFFPDGTIILRFEDGSERVVRPKTGGA
jgi:hypothetical protein